MAHDFDVEVLVGHLFELLLFRLVDVHDEPVYVTVSWVFPERVREKM